MKKSILISLLKELQKFDRFNFKSNCMEYSENGKYVEFSELEKLLSKIVLKGEDK